jgi:hypothetical protein
MKGHSTAVGVVNARKRRSVLCGALECVPEESFQGKLCLTSTTDIS